MRLCFLLIATLVIVSCHRTVAPAKNTPATTSASKPAPAPEAPVVVVNGDGKVVTPSVKTKTGSRAYPVTSARSFTPNQKKNLMYRFKTVPPRVLNVPASLAQQNANGSYYVYKGKFWYWKKSDGFYYLDENYYN